MRKLETQLYTVPERVSRLWGFGPVYFHQSEGDSTIGACSQVVGTSHERLYARNCLEFHVAVVVWVKCRPPVSQSSFKFKFKFRSDIARFTLLYV
jgi:hypothetical protein